MALRKQLTHQCSLPEVDDVTATYEWTCPTCGSEFKYGGGTKWCSTRQVGPFWNQRTVGEEHVREGFWLCTNRTYEWETVR